MSLLLTLIFSFTLANQVRYHTHTWVITVTCVITLLSNIKCDRLYENVHSSHLVVIRETPV